jgi:amidase
MAQAGPMARNPEDLEQVWKIIRGPHKDDRNTPRIEWKNAEGKSLSDYKVAWVDGWPGYETSSGIKSVIRNFVDQLTQNNCKTENTGPTNNLHERSLSLFVRLFALLISQNVPRFIRPLMKMQLKKGLLKGIDKFHQEFNKGFKNSFIHYSETMGIRAEIVSEWEQYFEKFDILVCPMSFGPAFKRCKIGTPINYDGKELIYINYAWPYLACFNASGHPGMNIPLGIGEEGLPVGVQIVGPYWSEPDLIQFAKHVSEFATGFVKPEAY